MAVRVADDGGPNQWATFRIVRFKSGSLSVALDGVTCRASLAAAVAKRVCCKKDVAARKRAQRMPTRRRSPL